MCVEQYEQLRAFYEGEGLEELRLREEGVQYLEFLTAARFLEKYLPSPSKILDSCAGTGVYAFHLARLGHAVTAGDIVSYNVELIQNRQATEPLLTDIYCGDALNLSRFADNSFDAVLCMGALYHLHDPAERRRAVEESVRVTREGGLVFCTYMNRYAVILNNSAGSLENLEEILTFVREGREGIFYASTPSEAEALLEGCGLDKACHAGLDGIGYFLHGTAGLLNEEGFLRWREYHLATCEEPSLLGCSYHNLLIGRKRGAVHTHADLGALPQTP